MKQRIEKFARECGAWNQVYGDRTFMIDEHFDIEKFTLLIVKECSNFLKDTLDDHFAAEQLEEHFGVEE